MNIKERFTTASLVGTIAFSGCLPEANGDPCRVRQDSITPGTPIIEFPSPIAGIIPEENEEEVYQLWRPHFHEEKISFSPETVKTEAANFVKGQLREICGDNLSVWQGRIDHLVGSTRFVQPYEFVVWSMYSQEQKIKEFLALYREDKRAAILELVKEQFLGYEVLNPELLFYTLYSDGAYYEERDEILINLNLLKFEQEEEGITNSVIHEIWHGFPITRTFQDSLGNWYSQRGLSLEIWDPANGWWVTAAPAPRFMFTGIQIDHALVYLMDPNLETTPAPADSSFVAIPFVQRAFEVFGRERVIRFYLGSKAEEFYGLVFYENCSDFAEFLSEGASCP